MLARAASRPPPVSRIAWARVTDAGTANSLRDCAAPGAAASTRASAVGNGGQSSTGATIEHSPAVAPGCGAERPPDPHSGAVRPSVPVFRYASATQPRRVPANTRSHTRDGPPGPAATGPTRWQPTRTTVPRRSLAMTFPLPGTARRLTVERTTPVPGAGSGAGSAAAPGAAAATTSRAQSRARSSTREGLQVLPGCRAMPRSTLRALLDLRRPRMRSPYGDHSQQLGELHLPAGPGPHPVVVALHGGFWRAPRTRRYMRPLCADLARHSWAAWNLEYRRVGRGQGGGWPATFDDVAAGIDHLASLDAPLDLARVATLGHSAGGHLALWAASRSDARVPVTLAAAAIAAVSDLEASPSLCQPGGAVHDLMGATPQADDARYALANPIRRLPLGVPVLLLHGTADETVPIRRSRDFASAARAAGDEVALIELEGVDHRRPVDPRTAAWAAARDWLAARR